VWQGFFVVIYRMGKEPKCIVVIGASSGGMNALSELLSQFHAGMDAAFFIVMHLAKKGMGDFLLYRLQPTTSLPCVIAKDGMAIEKGKVYFAPINKHLVVKNGWIVIGNGPEENRWRPSIDVLFRSAAAAYSSQTIGIILTGYLSDGTSGMLAIKRCEGLTIAQDPNQAEVPDMPLSVLENMEVDHCIPLSEMAPVIEEHIAGFEKKNVEIPADIVREAEIAEKSATGIDQIQDLGERSVYSCPDCGGHLWEMTSEKISRYRCNIGHAYTEREFFIKQAEALESTLWVAVRIMEERKNLMIKLENDYRRKGLATMSVFYKDKGEEMRIHIDKLKEILFDAENDATDRVPA
jgi:two-component system, chemotaxis family, protein-glutamate methylesterase/glutaminase